ncbi:Wzz/FepE/Etk N-terminal domain-containing protein [Cupriavidus plantarum]|uniref:Wzz/FepE/Etk N-terminal domain-containing protein n=1 Tax=Cupriavidus plantarum TaxID=942865 RepID=UPI000EB53DE2|nr:Wzz/FepE/Etk N-terminal domain-containing protein [Cupriavidus plantarum]NYH98075.1 hypothetical protein [Cupriavidus plantarum]RLK35494.1 capsular polysaccharide biosynthesis protein [Cupriavidus plantarum]
MTENLQREPRATLRGDGLTAGEGIDFIVRHKYLLLGLPVLGAIIAVLVALALPKQWQASTILQVGQLFYSTQSDQPQLALIEPTPRAVERVKLEQFQDAVLQRLNLPTAPNVNRDTDLLRASVNARLIRNAELLQISVRGNSPEMARRMIQAYQDQLVLEHLKLAEPSLQRIAAETAQVARDVTEAESRQKQLNALAIERAKVGVRGQFSESVLLNQLIDRNDKELRDLKRRASYLREQSSPERTFNTRAMGGIEVSKRPVWPRKINFLIIGGALGFAVGLVWSLLRERRARAAR